MQGDIQASANLATGLNLDYNGALHALFDLAGIAKGDFNGRLLAWINFQLGATYTEINGAMAALAAANGSANFAGMVSPFANQIPNPWDAGAAVGAPGTLPTGWASIPIGLSTSVVRLGQINGLNYIDIRFYGTTTGQYGSMRLTPNTGIPFVSGENSFGAVNMSFIDSTNIANISDYGIEFTYYNSGVYLSNGGIKSCLPITNVLSNYFTENIYVNASCNSKQLSFYFNMSGASAARPINT